MKHLIVVRGGGELGSAIARTLYLAGFRVLILEKAKPYATRRRVAFSDAMYRGEMTVERVTCYRVNSVAKAKERIKKGDLVIMHDPNARCVTELKPQVLIDAIVAQKNLGTKKDMAEYTIALGPGFCAGQDVNVVIDTMRGHNLGRLIYEGYSSKDPHSDAVVDADSNIDHILFAPEQGELEVKRGISLPVKKGEVIAKLHVGGEEVINIEAPFDGVLRGALHDGSIVDKGEKVAEVHPDLTQEECFTISDKARCLAGSVLAAIMIWDNKRPKKGFFQRAWGNR